MREYVYSLAIGLSMILSYSIYAHAVDISEACVIVEGLVFCGSKDCRTTSKGNVACGGLSKDCRTTSKGNVACGGLSKDCRTTSAGNVACGGMSKDCRTTSKGQVACGGQWETNSSMNAVHE